MKIDWKKLAIDNGMNPEQFTDEVMRLACACVATNIEFEGSTSTGQKYTFDSPFQTHTITIEIQNKEIGSKQ